MAAFIRLHAPSSQVPMQSHLDFFVDNVDEAEARKCLTKQIAGCQQSENGAQAGHAASAPAR
jgi:hypothetical protein